MPGLALPAFPDDVPTHPLLVVDYELIKAGDAKEIEILWRAATELGFWYLKNPGVDREVNEMFDMGEEVMALPLDEKLKFEQGDDGNSFGYKKMGAFATDEYGSPDGAEFINVAKDDAFAYPVVVYRTYPQVVYARMRNTIRPFIVKSLEILATLLKVIEVRLGIYPGALLERHNMSAHSGCEARLTRTLPLNPTDGILVDTPADAGVAKSPELQVLMASHTDFGSLTILHNRLGGLQVLPPESANGWQYIRPLPGHAVCNIGDALTIFSGGILRSNLHRVVHPPGEQTIHPRWSLAYFTRPANDVVLKALAEESEAVKSALDRLSPDQRELYYPNSTSLEWIMRRVRNQRLKNRTGPETWRASRGTEHKHNVI